ncbi:MULTISPECIES: lipoprotein [unclassified Bordetella]|uniref:LPS translocon maturation chaperone LptM n=1 Tax=unclassified Bordetella TaxID=2630031 RepID=UPI001EF15620|nr:MULTISPECIES: lipoprotein [unclassified Bordetella]
MVLRIVATLATFSLIAACGYKGPLYLPPQEPAPNASAQSEPPPSPSVSQHP